MAVARESLSPIIKSVHTRRLSLELCQKLFSSPNSNELKVPSQAGKTFWSPGKLLKQHQQQTSPNLFNRRGSETFEQSPSSIFLGKTRRASLTPLGSSNGLPLSFTPGGNGKNNFPIPEISVEESSPKNEYPPHLPGPKTGRKSSLGFRFSHVLDSSSDFSSFEDGNKENVFEEKRRVRRKSLAQCQRRKSSSARFDFDDDFMRFVSRQCHLEISPEEVLGKGSFGTVVAGQYRGAHVAVKMISTRGKKQKESMKGEENALSLLPHSHICKVHEIFRIGPDRGLVLLERCLQGNLLTVLNDEGIHIDEILRVRIAGEMASALAFCHLNGILHLDVKPQNVLIDSNHHCKISDFGNSKRVTELATLKDFSKFDGGTVAYTAPELFRGLCPTEKADVYSLAVSMWQILSRETPYIGENEHSVIFKVVAQNMRPRSVLLNRNFSFGNKVLSFVKIYEDSWHPDPTVRPNMKEIENRLYFLHMQNQRDQYNNDKYI